MDSAKDAQLITFIIIVVVDNLNILQLINYPPNSNTDVLHFWSEVLLG